MHTGVAKIKSWLIGKKLNSYRWPNGGKVIFFSVYKAFKSISSVFTRICPLSVDDIQLLLAVVVHRADIDERR